MSEAHNNTGSMNARSEAAPPFLLSGVAVPVEALRFLWELDERGFELRIDEDAHLLCVTHSEQHALTIRDDDMIRRYGFALVALVRTASRSQYGVQ